MTSPMAAWYPWYLTAVFTSVAEKILKRSPHNEENDPCVGLPLSDRRFQ